MKDGPPVVVIGGTRGTGFLIAQLLASEGRHVRVLARNPSWAAARQGIKVQVCEGDVTRPDSLAGVIAGASHIVFTAGVRSGRPATERRVRETEYQGVINTLEAAEQVGFDGRFLYMTSSGVHARSLFATGLNMYKGNTLRWRARAEEEIRTNSVDYSIIRTGMLLNAPAGTRAIRFTQEELPLAFRHRISRADVAEAFVAALDHPRASRVTFELVWSNGDRAESWSALLAHLRPDADLVGQ